jgi:putative DNA primase/helicase
MFPVKLFEAGYTDLISVIPPKATLSPNSKMATSSLGKAPGVRYQNGTWGGYNWRKSVATLKDVQQWIQDGANVGLRAGRFPGLDIDSLNEHIVAKVKELAWEVLGPAPIRIGKAPKTLLMYRTDEPFARMRITLEGEKETHLIEMLGDGQQYLVHGIHATTLRPYSWPLEPPNADQLTPVTAEKVNALFLAIKAHYEGMGFTVRREGNGQKQERASASDQSALHAPSIDSLRIAVAAIPNNEAFKDRDAWIKMGYAIRAACGDNLEEGLEIFSEWSERWTEGTNDPEDVRANWNRMSGRYSVGWPWIAEKARGFGYNDAQDDFPVDPNAVPTAVVQAAPPQPGPMRLSDMWLADEVLDDIGDRLRYVAARGAWYVWDGSYWVPDATEQARAAVAESLREVSIRETAGNQGATVVRDAKLMESANTLGRVLSLVRADRGIAVKVDALDSNPWALNTPGGVVNLKDGTVNPGLPEQLHTKQTRVAPQHGDAPIWSRFLIETTGGDMALVGYLQRLVGYCLTGLTSEQVLVFIWGPGGNGKSVFLNAVSEILGDYATVATMDVFSASNMDRHTTDIADMMGSRLVTASETQVGRRWDEQRLKMLSGGERIKARFMRQDNVMFRPTFKLLFSGNHEPRIRSLDEAMRRRIHIVPFTRKPEVRDPMLSEKLRAEYPAILDWMLLGCMKWQQDGLVPPESVLAQTSAFFEGEDILSQWIADRCDTGPDKSDRLRDLFESWKEWCGENGEKYVGRAQDLLKNLRTHGIEFMKHPKDRGAIAHGIAVNPQASIDMEVGV